MTIQPGTEKCFCTEELIVRGCSIHDHVEYIVPDEFAQRLARFATEYEQARAAQENREPK